LGWVGLGPTRPQKRKEERRLVGSRSAQPFWADISPHFSRSELGPVI